MSTPHGEPFIPKGTPVKIIGGSKKSLIGQLGVVRYVESGVGTTRVHVRTLDNKRAWFDRKDLMEVKSPKEVEAVSDLKENKKARAEVLPPIPEAPSQNRGRRNRH